MKKKIIAILLVLVALISTVGVGFASWVISRPVEVSAQGNVTVDVVSEEAITVTLKWGEYVNNQVTDLTGEDIALFNLVGPTGNDTAAGKWLTYSSVSAKERLEVVLQISVVRDNAETPLFNGDIYISEGTLSNATAKLSTVVNGAVTATYINGPVYSTTHGGLALTAETGEGNHVGAYKITVTNGEAQLFIKLSWGAYFGTNNPYEYYNSHLADEIKTPAQGQPGDANYVPAVKYAEDAEKTLKALNTLFNGSNDDNATAGSVSFGYTVYVSASDANSWSNSGN